MPAKAGAHSVPMAVPLSLFIDLSSELKDIIFEYNVHVGHMTRISSTDTGIEEISSISSVLFFKYDGMFVIRG